MIQAIYEELSPSQGSRRRVPPAQAMTIPFSLWGLRGVKQQRRVLPSYLRQCHCLHYDWLNHITWKLPNTAWRQSSWLIHSRSPLEFKTILLQFVHHTDANMLHVGCLIIANICTYIFLYIRNSAISVR